LPARRSVLSRKLNGSETTADRQYCAGNPPTFVRSKKQHGVPDVFRRTETRPRMSCSGRLECRFILEPLSTITVEIIAGHTAQA
jgi:hypothetical protein